MEMAVVGCAKGLELAKVAVAPELKVWRASADNTPLWLEQGCFRADPLAAMVSGTLRTDYGQRMRLS
jgi:hypothetical protein